MNFSRGSFIREHHKRMGARENAKTICGSDAVSEGSGCGVRDVCSPVEHNIVYEYIQYLTGSERFQ